MPDSSAIALLGILQQHGLTMEFLEAWAAFCERRQSGVFLIHHHQGNIEFLEAHYKGSVHTLHRDALQVGTLYKQT